MMLEHRLLVVEYLNPILLKLELKKCELKWVIIQLCNCTLVFVVTCFVLHVFVAVNHYSLHVLQMTLVARIMIHAHAHTHLPTYSKRSLDTYIFAYLSSVQHKICIKQILRRWPFWLDISRNPCSYVCV